MFMKGEIFILLQYILPSATENISLHSKKPTENKTQRAFFKALWENPYEDVLHVIILVGKNPFF